MTDPQGCGTCTLCCKVAAVAELEKPADSWCKHCAVGKGCKIYDQRPQSCADFQCLWLKSQSWEDSKRMGPNLRPDRCHVVIDLSVDGLHLVARVDKNAPDAWQRGELGSLLQGMARRLSPAMVIVGGLYLRIDRDGSVKEAVMGPEVDGIRKILGVKPWRGK